MTVAPEPTGWPILLTAAEVATLADAAGTPVPAELAHAFTLPVGDELTPAVQAAGIASLCARDLVEVTPDGVRVDARAAFVVSVLAAPTLAIVVVMQSPDQMAAVRYVADDRAVLMVRPTAPGVVSVAAYETDVSIAGRVQELVAAFLDDGDDVTVAVRREIGGPDDARALGVHRRGDELLARPDEGALHQVDEVALRALLAAVVAP